MSPLEQLQHLQQLLSGAWVTQMLHVAAELQIADLLAEGPREVEELASLTGCHQNSLFRLLRGLASLGIFEETEPRRFALTPLGEYLRSDNPQSQRNFARLVGDEHYLAWADLDHAVRHGSPAFRHRYGTSVFEHYQQHPERGAVFDEAMSSMSRLCSQAVLAAYDFSGLSQLVDVGGGRGELLVSLLRHHPHLQGTVIDQPQVVAPVEVPADLEGRLQLVGGDFFTAVPAGGDGYLLKHILHDWGEDDCLRLLRRIREAMAPGGRLLVLEQVIPPGNGPFPGKLLDLNMLVMTEGGRERTSDEYALLLEQAGLQLSRILPTAAPLSVVEAVAS
ncbi:MAG: methyltransferase [Cyanobacteriota bacterium]